MCIGEAQVTPVEVPWFLLFPKFSPCSQCSAVQAFGPTPPLGHGLQPKALSFTCRVRCSWRPPGGALLRSVPSGFALGGGGGGMELWPLFLLIWGDGEVKVGVRPGREEKGWGVGRWDQMQLTNQDNGVLPLADALRKQRPASPPSWQSW